MAKQWFESDKFWATYGPAIFNPDILKSTPVQVDKILEWTAPEPGAHVLDLGCGVGRHSLELARRGYRVTGVDRTRLFLAEARKTAKAEKLRVELVRSDMREFVRPDTFHLAINLFTTRLPAPQEMGEWMDVTENQEVQRQVTVRREGGYPEDEGLSLPRVSAVKVRFDALSGDRIAGELQIHFADRSVLLGGFLALSGPSSSR